nr:buccalin B, BUCb [Aplysia californica, accessory radula closer muscle, Peptide, 11 aa] [Aplysia californica]
GLDRYGFVGGL